MTIQDATDARPAPGGRVRAACPGCGGARSEVGHVGELPLGALCVLQETRVCLSCGLVFERSQPDQDWPALYGTLWQRGALPSARQRALYADDARRLGAGHGRRAYEIGCGTGLLLDELAENGWRTAGCEPERAAAELARSKGHDVSVECFAPRPGRVAELVVLGDVLEHQADPRAFLADARSLLTPSGRLYLRVPDLDSIDRESFGDVFGLQHRVWFTRGTLRAFLERAGLELELAGGFGRGQHALARRAEPRPLRCPPGEPEHSLELVRSYSRALGERRRRIDERLRALAGREVALYGGGEHAQELLAFSALGRLATRVVDGNRALLGRRCGRLVIEAPESLRERPPAAVVVASRAYQDDIVEALADLAHRGVEIVTLYPSAVRRAA